MGFVTPILNNHGIEEVSKFKARLKDIQQIVDSKIDDPRIKAIATTMLEDFALRVTDGIAKSKACHEEIHKH